MKPLPNSPYIFSNDNPQTEHSIMLSVPAFVNLFREKVKSPFIISLEQTFETLKRESVELDNHYMFFIRSEYEFMENESKDGIFTANSTTPVGFDGFG